MELTTENMAALSKWQSEGKRSVEVKIDSLRSEDIVIWAYDYNYQNGFHIKNISDLPTEEVFIAEQTAKIEEEKIKLREQLKQLETVA